MIEEEIFLLTVEILNKLKIPYMVAGAMAANYYGEPRLTHDLDIIIYIGLSQVPKILESFKDKFYVSQEGILDALKHESMFNLIHLETSFKVDFWILKEEEFEKTMFERKVLQTIFNQPVYLATPEDLIISKLDWFKTSQSDKHYRDAMGMYRVQKDTLDIPYIKKWALKKSTIKLFEKIEKGEGINYT